MGQTINDFEPTHPDGACVDPRKVLMLAFLFPPTAAAGCFRTLRFTKYLPGFGWQPFVVTARPEFTGYPSDDSLAAQIPPHTLVRRTNVWYMEETLFGWFRHLLKMGGRSRTDAAAGQSNPLNDSRNIPSCRSLVNRLQGIRNRLFFTPDRYIAWTKYAIHAAKRLVSEHDFNAMYSTSPPHSTHVIAMRIKERTGLPWIADFRDPWANAPWYAEGRSRKATQLSERLEGRCVRMADRVVLNTETMLADFRRRYPDQEANKFIAIPNGFDPALLEQIQDFQPARGGRDPSPFCVCHPGSLYGKRDLRPFLHGLKSLASGHGDVVFEQIGCVDASFKLSEFIRQEGLDNIVRIEGTLDHRATLRRMAAADAFLVVQPGTSTQIPGKLYEMIPFEKPILALTEDGATADIVKRYGLGAVSDPNNVDEITESLGRIVGGRGTRDTNRQQALKDFNGCNLVQRLATLLDSISGASAETA